MNDTPHRDIDDKVTAVNKTLMSRFAIVAKARANIWFTTAVVLSVIGFVGGIVYVADPNILKNENKDPYPAGLNAEYFNREPSPIAQLLIRKSGTKNLFTHRPLYLKAGDKIELRWSTDNVQSCSSTNGWLEQSGFRYEGTNVYPLPISSDTTFDIFCTGQFGNASDSVQVLIQK